MSKKKVAIIAMAIALSATALIAWATISRRRRLESQGENATGNGATTTSASWITEGKDLDGEIVFPVRRGDKGTVVSWLQKALNDMYGAGLAVDGKFGAKTEAALQQYCQSKELTEAGYTLLAVAYGNWRKKQ